MKVEIVPITTADGVPITGGFWEPAPGVAAVGVDAWLLLPGQSGTFYSQVQGPFAQALTEAGYPCLTLSTRGHDLAWIHFPTRRVYGTAGELLSECIYDIRAALDVLESRGFRRVGLLGHSLGAIKSYYFLRQGGDPRVVVFADVSGPRIGPGRWKTAPNAAQAEEAIAEAERLVAAGLGDRLHYFLAPFGPTYHTPTAFLDRYTTDRYDVVTNAPFVRVPLIVLRGSEEPEIAPDGFIEEKLALATQANPREAHTIAGADHFFSKGTHAPAIAAIVAFTRRLGG